MCNGFSYWVFGRPARVILSPASDFPYLDKRLGYPSAGISLLPSSLDFYWLGSLLSPTPVYFLGTLPLVPAASFWGGTCFHYGDPVLPSRSVSPWGLVPPFPAASFWDDICPGF